MTTTLAEVHPRLPLEAPIPPSGLRIVVVGLGYVGAPLALALAETYDVVGVDLRIDRVEELQRGEDSTRELDLRQLAATRCRFETSLDFARGLVQRVIYIVTVPTPVTDANTPDLRPVEGASRDVASVIKAGDVVVYESTVYPGVTEEVCVPILESTGYKWLKDFNVGYSPERINPGDKVHTLWSTKKIVAGDTPETLALLAKVYSTVTEVYEASTIKVAEAAKVIENTQRDVNIALMNELSQVFNRLGIDTHDVIDAAASKWNFIDFRPGLVGGHCISVDPFYLTHRAAIAGYTADLILSSRQINDEMVDHIVNETARMMFVHGVGATPVTIVGCTFKENVPDIRNSKVFKIAQRLERNFGLTVQLYDPWADLAEVEHEYGMKHVILPQLLKPAKVVLLTVPHKVVLEQGWKAIEELTQPDAPYVVMDVKAALDRATKPGRCRLWRP